MEIKKPDSLVSRQPGYFKVLETRCFPFPDDSGFGFFLNLFLAKGQGLTEVSPNGG